MNYRKIPKIDLSCSPFLLSIRRSKIDRYGVFAGETIPPLHKVMIYGGEKIRKKEALVRAAGLRARTFLAGLNRNWVIDGSVGGNGAERINHCCDPNASFRRAYSSAAPTVSYICTAGGRFEKGKS